MGEWDLPKVHAANHRPRNTNPLLRGMSVPGIKFQERRVLLLHRADKDGTFAPVTYCPSIISA